MKLNAFERVVRAALRGNGVYFTKKEIAELATDHSVSRRGASQLSPKKLKHKSNEQPK